MNFPRVMHSIGTRLPRIFQSLPLPRQRLSMCPLLIVLVLNRDSAAVNDAAGRLIVWNDNGGWSWFEDERAIVDSQADSTIVSSVANGSGTLGHQRKGDIDVAAYSWTDDTVRRHVIAAQFEQDDHDSAALWMRPDGRYLAMYSKHSSDSLSRYKISTNPHDISSWAPEHTFDNQAATTYSNLHYLPSEKRDGGRLYNFSRTVNFNPNFIFSDDQGDSWSYGGQLLAIGNGTVRPYVRYASNGRRIHLITTEHHPLSADTSIYHGFIESQRLHDSSGAVLDGSLLDRTAAPPNRLTQVFAASSKVGGTPMHRAWTIDLELDGAGQPYAVFSARANNHQTDHRFFYARWNGTTWSVFEVAKAGGFLYEGEFDYTGLAALDPVRPDRIYISTNIDPRNAEKLAHYEIFAGSTSDGGECWSWQPVTANSTMDNIRPVVPKGNRFTLIWLRGVYHSYKNYDLAVVGLTAIVPLTTTGEAKTRVETPLQ